MDGWESRTVDVLIVEDDLALLAFLVTRLEYEPDFRVVGYATHGAEALQLASEASPDIVLTDFDLPDVEGLELVGALRALLPEASLVLYTAAWSERLEREARLNGADDCLDKTVAPSALVAALRACAGSRRAVVLDQAQTAL